MSIMELRTAQAVKKHAGLKLRGIGIPDPENFEPHLMEWSKLNAAQRSVGDISRGVLDKMDGADEAEERSLSEAHDGLMAVYDLISEEKDYRIEQGNRGARTESARAARRPIPRDSVWYGESARSEGRGGHEAPDVDLAYALRPEQRMADWAREHGKNRQEFGVSAGALLRAMVLGPKNDEEKRALSEGTDSAGGFTVPDILSAQLIDRLRAQSVLVRAGARTVPLSSDQNYIAKIATDPVPAWRAENAAIAESDPTFTRVSMAPKSLAVLVKVSREVLEDSLNIEEALQRSLTAAMAVEFDRAGLFGSGTGSEPEGLVNMAGIGALAHNAVLANYLPLNTARTAVLTANATPTAYIMHPREDGKLTGLVDAQGQPLQAAAKVAAIQQLTTTAVPINGGVGTNEASIITGDFSRYLIGIRNGLRIEILKERYAENFQFAFVAHLRGTFAVEHVAAFHKITGIKP
ncbi:phage major capsid protein [Brevundimonas subvibrioides]|uniref:phage major capsid protein n=1 Tax=Brevundimonas subvibrioides TaxID=74313 RepID=UPI0022B47B58|nr:phage major capsid protein [Brevundimonas subvibrioides]